MARKGWDELSPSYRKRLQRGGIDKIRYQLNTPLHQARGHVSQQVESDYRQLWRLVDKAGIDRDDAKAVIDEIGREEALDILKYRDIALNPHDPIEALLAAGSMRNLYGQYEGIVPKEWLYYHGRAG